jgi:two-component system, sensor histidine kinase PdtaS
MSKIPLLLLLFSCISAGAQPIKHKMIDSLQSLAVNAPTTELKVKYYYLLTGLYRGTDETKRQYYLKEFYHLSRKIGYQKGIAKYYAAMTTDFFSKGDGFQAVKYGHLARSEFKKINDTANYLDTTSRIANALVLSAKLNEARLLIEEAMKMPGIIPFVRERAHLHRAMSNLALQQGQSAEALRELNVAIRLYDTVKEFSDKHACYFVMAEIYRKSHDWRNTRKYAYTYLTRLFDSPYRNDYNLMLAYKAVAEAELKVGRIPQAEKYASRALALGEKYQHKKETAELLNDLTQIYLLKKEYNKAQAAAHRALTFNGAMADADYQLELRNKLRKAYIALDDKGAASRETTQIKRLLGASVSRGKLEVSDPDLLNDLSELEYGKENYKNAYDYYRQYAQYQIDRLQREKDSSVVRLQAQFELTDKSLKIKDLTIKQQSNRLKIARQRNSIIAVVAILLLLIVTSVILWRAYRAKRKNNQLLKQKNDIIELALKEKSLLLREIHHRVKNNLQLIISLLNIQSRENNHAVVDAFLEKGRNRIISMALIHQNLYETDNLTRVNFEEYLHKLAHAAMASFKYDDQQITFEIGAKDIYFDINNAIPLGLITNELICNALKHAFNDKNHGKISIRVEKTLRGDYHFHFSDNGIGHHPTNSKKSFGKELVSLLTMQLNGKLRVSSLAGTVYDITFQEPAVA